ncbi:unnamed protein product, partial [Laminaria digitata]
GDGAVGSSPTSGRNVEQKLDNVQQEFRNVQQEFYNVGQATQTGIAPASDPSSAIGDTPPPAAAAADGGERETQVRVKTDQALPSEPTIPLPTEEEAGAGTPEAEALTNKD